MMIRTSAPSFNDKYYKKTLKLLTTVGKEKMDEIYRIQNFNSVQNLFFTFEGKLYYPFYNLTDGIVMRRLLLDAAIIGL